MVLVTTSTKHLLANKTVLRFMFSHVIIQNTNISLIRNTEFFSFKKFCIETGKQSTVYATTQTTCHNHIRL